MCIQNQSWGFKSRSIARVILGQVLITATCGTRTHRGESPRLDSKLGHRVPIYVCKIPITCVLPRLDIYLKYGKIYALMIFLLPPPRRLCFCVIWFVRLLVCEQDNSKTYGRILM